MDTHTVSSHLYPPRLHVGGGRTHASGSGQSGGFVLVVTLGLIVLAMALLALLPDAGHAARARTQQVVDTPLRFAEQHSVMTAVLVSFRYGNHFAPRRDPYPVKVGHTRYDVEVRAFPSALPLNTLDRRRLERALAIAGVAAPDALAQKISEMKNIQSWDDMYLHPDMTPAVVDALRAHFSLGGSGQGGVYPAHADAAMLAELSGVPRAAVEKAMKTPPVRRAAAIGTSHARALHPYLRSDDPRGAPVVEVMITSPFLKTQVVYDRHRHVILDYREG